MKRLWSALSVAALVAMAASGVCAEDPPSDKAGSKKEKSGSKKETEQAKRAEELTPSPLTDLRREQLERDADPVDPIEYLRSYREWVAENAQAPTRTERDRGLYDVWHAALKPRAGRMVKHIDILMKRKYWLPDTGMPERVKPEQWSRFVGEIAALGTELHGAWKAYSKARLTDRKQGLGKVPTTRVPSRGYYGRGHSGLLWRGAVLGRQSVADLNVGYELRSYRNLLDTYRRGWGWRRQENRLAGLRKKKREFVAAHKKELHTTRDTLEQQMLSLQVLAAAMQALEEDSLRRELAELPDDHMLRKPAEQILSALREARLKAERYSGTSSSEYGQLLRGWVRAYRAGTVLLTKEVKKLEADEADGD